MADPLTLVVSAAGLASLGIQLAQGLNKYAGSALDSKDRIRAISIDIDLTVQVVQALDATIKDDAYRAMMTDDAFILAQEAGPQCWDIFKKIRDTFPKNNAKTGPRKRDFVTWPFIEPKLELLRANLEKVKTTFQLLMNSAIRTANLYYRQAEQALLDQQRHQIEKLLEQKAAAEARLEVLECDHAQVFAAQPPKSTSSGHAHVQPAIAQQSRNSAGPTQEDPDHIPASNDALVPDCSCKYVNRFSIRSHTGSESNIQERCSQVLIESTSGLDKEKALLGESLINSVHDDYISCLEQLKTLQAKLEMALNEMFIPTISAPAINPKLANCERRNLARAVDKSVWKIYNCFDQRIVGSSAHSRLIVSW